MPDVSVSTVYFNTFTSFFTLNSQFTYELNLLECFALDKVSFKIYFLFSFLWLYLEWSSRRLPLFSLACSNSLSICLLPSVFRSIYNRANLHEDNSFHPPDILLDLAIVHCFWQENNWLLNMKKPVIILDIFFVFGFSVIILLSNFYPTDIFFIL